MEDKKDRIKLPTAVLSTTVRAKARAKKKEEAKGKEGGEGAAPAGAAGAAAAAAGAGGAEDMDTDKAAGLGDEGAVDGEGGEAKPQDKGKEKKEEAISFVGRCWEG